jgi:flagellar hook-basal body complex protein FliE
MISSAMAAAKAYSQVQSGFAAPTKGLMGAPSQGPDFAQLVQGAMKEVTETGRHAEQQMVAHTNGKAELVDVVTAVASAQSSLETALAVRDQVISAYQEIMRMPI